MNAGMNVIGNDNLASNTFCWTLSGTAISGDNSQIEIPPSKESNLEWLERRIREICDCWKE
mgnify:FL=1